jgi:hypothetical protein
LTPVCDITIAPPEYVILHKLEFFREGGSQKHLRDIAGIIEQQDLDHTYLDQAIRQLHLEPQWQAAIAFN